MLYRIEDRCCFMLSSSCLVLRQREERLTSLGQVLVERPQHGGIRRVCPHQADDIQFRSPNARPARA